jgi:hypothetical protein
LIARQLGPLLDEVGRDPPADVPDEPQLAAVDDAAVAQRSAAPALDISIDVRRVARGPDLEGGVELARGDRRELAVLVDLDELDRVAELPLEQDLRDVRVDRRPGPGVDRDPERDARAGLGPDWGSSSSPQPATRRTSALAIATRTARAVAPITGLPARSGPRVP